jgi:protein-S-isoprenylcysteine O-methyltransferase Ste14
MQAATSRGTSVRALLGGIAIGLFVILYGIEIVHPGPPITVRWVQQVLGTSGLIVLNIAIVLAFLALLPYRRPTRHVWKSRGIFAAFVIALMTEMFGWPLVLFLLAPLVEIPELARASRHAFGAWHPEAVGTALSLLGLALIAIGWWQIHRASGLVTTGLYRYMRHPQYTGILLFTLGWLIHWPSVVTLLLWPILVAAYGWLARQEERQLEEEFGSAYLEYAARTKRFLPFLV